MELLIGILLAMFSIAFARLMGFDRDRAFFPMLLIVIATYYILFAVMTPTRTALLPEVLGALLFFGFAVIGYKVNPWFVVAGLFGHSVFDLIHKPLFVNPGVPGFWPMFCAGFDVVLATYWSMLVARRTVGGLNSG